MDQNFKEFLASGKSLISDTKVPKSQTVKAPKKGMDAPVSSNPHHNFIKRCIDDKIKKSEVVEEFKKFIEQAESEL